MRLPGLVGFASDPSMAEASILHQMLSPCSQGTHLQLCHRQSAIGSFACLHHGLFNHSIVATSHHGRVGVFLDGWIYNEPSNGKSDAAATCLESYLSQGIDFVKNLNGEFNIILWDERIDSLYLTNDRYGLRPLQYGYINGTLFFAPEGKSIMAGSKRQLKLDLKMVVNWLSIGRALLGTRTFIDGVNVLPAASVLKWAGSKLTHWRYWNYKHKPIDAVDDDFIDMLTKAFRQSVRRRIQSRIPYGVTLSGGLDSRMVASALADVSPDSSVAFTFGMEDSDEVLLAGAVAKRLRMHWELLPLGPEAFVEHAAQGVRLTEGLDIFVQSYGLTAYPRLQKLVGTAFTGLGLDVTLGGSYLDEYLMGPGVSEPAVEKWVRERLTYFDDDTVCRLFGSSDAVQEVHDLFSEDWRATLENAHPADRVDAFVFRHRVSRMLFVRQNWQRCFIEDLTPTFDNEFVDLLLQIPARERHGHQTYQRFMHRLCPHLMDIPYQRTLLPPSVPTSFWANAARIEAEREQLCSHIWRDTHGRVSVPYKRYSTNYDGWLRGNPQWIQLADDLLVSPKSRLMAIGLHRHEIVRLLEEHRKGLRSNRQRLLQLMTLEFLLRELFS